MEALNQRYKGEDPTTMLMFNSTINRERLKKWHPETDEDNLNSEIQNELYLDPYEYRNILIIS
jgi:hypothetical protein